MKSAVLAVMIALFSFGAIAPASAHWRKPTTHEVKVAVATGVAIRYGKPLARGLWSVAKAIGKGVKHL